MAFAAACATITVTRLRVWRSNQVNNALAFPGLFKAALEVQAEAITSAMKIAAAEAISALAPEGELVPSPFHPLVHAQVVEAVKRAAGA